MVAGGFQSGTMDQYGLIRLVDPESPTITAFKQVSSETIGMGVDINVGCGVANRALHGFSPYRVDELVFIYVVSLGL